MLSLLTNTSAASALRILGSTQASLAQTQARVSSGLRVAGASDGAAYWSIGVKMRSQIGTLSAVDAGIDLNASIASVTSTAVGAILSLMQGMRDDLVTAAEPGVDATVIQDDISARQQQIIGIANSASFNGQNWLVQNKTAHITITETHQLDDTYAHIVQQGLANIDYRDEAHPPYLDPTTPFPTGYAFNDAVTYAAKAVETDSTGTKKAEAIAYAGTDQDQDYTQQFWFRYFDDPTYRRGQSEARRRNSFSAPDPSNETVTGNVDYRDAEAARIPMTVAGDGAVALTTVDTTQFGLFTHYTGSTTVTETTTDAPTVTEFVVIGLVPAMSTDLGATTTQIGAAVTAYALGVSIGGPVLTAVTVGWPRKSLLLSAMALFVAGNLAVASSPGLVPLLGARFASGLAHGVFLAVASSVAASVVGPARAGRAVAVVFSGLTIALVLGVPAGTFLGSVWSWRAVFGFVTACAAVGLTGLIFSMPNVTDRVAAMARDDEPFEFDRSHLRAVLFLLAALLRRLIGVEVAGDPVAGTVEQVDRRPEQVVEIGFERRIGEPRRMCPVPWPGRR